jgi:hypothetical protein
MVRYHLQYIEYEVLINSKVVCLWFTKNSVFAAKSNLELKPQANYIKISSINVAISPPINRISDDIRIKKVDCLIVH